MKKAFKVDKDPIMGDFYNRRQHAYKIKLNDVYDVFAKNSWRYTDGHKMISKAITLTGQRLTQESIKLCNKNNKRKIKYSIIKIILSLQIPTHYLSKLKIYLNERRH
jgi:DNA polymerase elongation subunit (family B)